MNNIQHHNLKDVNVTTKPQHNYSGKVSEVATYVTSGNLLGYSQKKKESDYIIPEKQVTYDTSFHYPEDDFDIKFTDSETTEVKIPSPSPETANYTMYIVVGILLLIILAGLYIYRKPSIASTGSPTESSIESPSESPMLSSES